MRKHLLPVSFFIFLTAFITTICVCLSETFAELAVGAVTGFLYGLLLYAFFGKE